jgi:hypothetical protein
MLALPPPQAWSHAAHMTAAMNERTASARAESCGASIVLAFIALCAKGRMPRRNAGEGPAKGCVDFGAPAEVAASLQIALAN